MKIRIQLIHCLFVLLPLGSNAGTNITDRDEIVTEKISKPAHIWVYDFAATAADLPSDSALAGQASEYGTPQTNEQIATGRKVGAETAAQLVEQIRDMGMPAEQATSETKPHVNDLVIRAISSPLSRATRRNGLPSASVPATPS